jgi:hypothetical protein
MKGDESPRTVSRDSQFGKTAKNAASGSIATGNGIFTKAAKDDSLFSPNL